MRDGYKATITLDEILDDEEKERLINSMTYHAMGTDHLIKIAEISGKLQDNGIDVHKVLELLLEIHERDGRLDLNTINQ